MNIRLAQLTDIPHILPLMKQYYEYDHLVFDEGKAELTLREFLAPHSNFGRLWLYCTPEICGYMAVTYGYSLEYAGKAAFVDELFLVENCRGKGIGSHLIEHAMMECKKEGFHALRLEVTPTNKSALKLYERLGFQNLDRSLLTYTLK